MKLYKIISILFISLVMCSCSSNINKVNLISDENAFVVSFFENLEIVDYYDESCFLPLLKDEIEIKWDSNIKGLISSDGKIVPSKTADLSIVLTATIDINSHEYTYDYLTYIEKQKYSKYDLIEFNEFLDQLFIELLKGDALSINFTLLKPEVYDLDKEIVGSLRTELSKEDISNRLKEFKYSTLSINQQYTYDILKYYFIDQVDLDCYNDLTTNLGSYLGYNAQIPAVLAEYHFRNLNDIENYFSYLKMLINDFKEIIAHEKSKVEKNTSMPNYIINGIIDQADNLINSKEIFLIEVFNEKIAECDFIDNVLKYNLISKHKKIINNDFKEAYIYLKNEMKLLLDKGVNELGYKYYENGSNYYEALFQKNCSTNMKVDDLIIYLEDKIDYYLNILLDDKDNKLKDELEQLDLLGDKSIEEIIPYLEELCEEDFPKINNYQYKLTAVSKALQKNSSPAYYFSSVIDSNVIESIYYNPLDFNDLSDKTVRNNLFQTIAHEAYPGHMYQYIYFKNNENNHNVLSTINFNCFTEGWAVYAENEILKYLIDDEKLRDYYIANKVYTYLVYARADIGINYEGWNLIEVKNHFNKYYFDISISAAKSIIETFVEIPTNYLKYYFGYLQIMDMKDKVIKVLGSSFSNYEFHEVILEYGPIPFSILEYRINEYLIIKQL